MRVIRTEVLADGKATVTHSLTLYNRGEQVAPNKVVSKSISMSGFVVKRLETLRRVINTQDVNHTAFCNGISYTVTE